MAISHSGGPKGATHDLREHLEGTATLAEAAAAEWGAGEAARLAGLWHDLGKYAAAFQEMISTDADGHLEDRKPDGAPKKRVLCSLKTGSFLVRFFR